MLLPLTALLILLAPASVRGQEIWFGPRTPDYSVIGVKDWDLLFHPNPEWNQLTGQIQVFLAAAGFFLITPDDQLQAMAADLAKRHIGWAMETGSIAQRPNEDCDRREGYANPNVIPRVASKLTRLGIRLSLVRLDGPLWSGHYQGCQLPVAEVATRVADTMRPLLDAFPDMAVGNVEAVGSLSQYPDWQANYVTFVHDVEPAMGRKMAFLHVDINWREPNWTTVIPASARLAHSLGEKFGVIYNSDGLAPSDEVWVAEAKRHFDELETRYGLIPDQAVFHTWDAHPTHVFPETSDASHSYLIAQYLLPRTHLIAHHSPTGVQGRLTQVSGQPVAGAPIAVDVVGDDPNTPPPIRTISGTVPPDARYAVLGLRVNTECFCSGTNDVMFGPLSYQETAGGSVHYEYRQTAPPRVVDPDVAATPVLVANQPLIRLKVAPSRTYAFNSAIFPVTPGAQFQFQVPIGSLNGTGMAGTVTVIWMDAQQHGYKRAYVTVGNDDTPIAAAVTDASGGFAVALPDSTHWRERPLLAQYAGSPTLRAAYAEPK
jgi:hypothetical protein